MKIHFSVDDVFGAFKWLTNNNATSIFESYVFSTAREIYDNYNIATSMYCMYSDGKTTLVDISDKWKHEFLSNRNWLHFGFHCYRPDSDYTRTRLSEFAHQYEQTVNELNRITGNVDESIIRTHFFSGNSAIVNFLAQKEIQALLYADDERVCYDVDIALHNEITLKGYGMDSMTGMMFYKTDLRIEKMIENKEFFKDVFRQKDRVEIFTHEKFLGDKKIQLKIKEIFDYINQINQNELTDRNI